MQDSEKPARLLNVISWSKTQGRNKLPKNVNTGKVYLKKTWQAIIWPY